MAGEKGGMVASFINSGRGPQDQFDRSNARNRLVPMKPPPLDIQRLIRVERILFSLFPFTETTKDGTGLKRPRPSNPKNNPLTPERTNQYGQLRTHLRRPPPARHRSANQDIQIRAALRAGEQRAEPDNFKLFLDLIETRNTLVATTQSAATAAIDLHASLMATIKSRTTRVVDSERRMIP